MEKQALQDVSLANQQQAVLHFMRQLDIDMVDACLHDGKTYQDMPKPIFIQKLGVAFDEFISQGDTKLTTYKGFCQQTTCNYKCTGYRFLGNQSGNYMDLIVDATDGQINDMYECHDFLCAAQGKTYNQCIYIEPPFEFLGPLPNYDNDDDVPF